MSGTAQTQIVVSNELKVIKTVWQDHKHGLFYFPFDVKFFRDPKIRKAKNKYNI